MANVPWRTVDSAVLLLEGEDGPMLEDKGPGMTIVQSDWKQMCDGEPTGLELYTGQDLVGMYGASGKTRDASERPVVLVFGSVVPESLLTRFEEGTSESAVDDSKTGTRSGRALRAMGRNRDETRSMSFSLSPEPVPSSRRGSSKREAAIAAEERAAEAAATAAVPIELSSDSSESEDDVGLSARQLRTLGTPVKLASGNFGTVVGGGYAAVWGSVGGPTGGNVTRWLGRALEGSTSDGAELWDVDKDERERERTIGAEVAQTMVVGSFPQTEGSRPIVVRGGDANRLGCGRYWNDVLVDLSIKSQHSLVATPVSRWRIVPTPSSLHTLILRDAQIRRGQCARMQRAKEETDRQKILDAIVPSEKYSSVPSSAASLAAAQARLRQPQLWSDAHPLWDPFACQALCLPICESSHWSLVVLFNAWASLPTEEEALEDAQNARKQLQELDVPLQSVPLPPFLHTTSSGGGTSSSSSSSSKNISSGRGTSSSSSSKKLSSGAGTSSSSSSKKLSSGGGTSSSSSSKKLSSVSVPSIELACKAMLERVGPYTAEEEAFLESVRKTIHDPDKSAANDDDNDDEEEDEEKLAVDTEEVVEKEEEEEEEEYHETKSSDGEAQKAKKRKKSSRARASSSESLSSSSTTSLSEEEEEEEEGVRTRKRSSSAADAAAEVSDWTELLQLPPAQPLGKFRASADTVVSWLQRSMYDLSRTVLLVVGESVQSHLGSDLQEVLAKLSKEEEEEEEEEEEFWEKMLETIQSAGCEHPDVASDELLVSTACRVLDIAASVPHGATPEELALRKQRAEAAAALRTTESEWLRQLVRLRCAGDAVRELEPPAWEGGLILRALQSLEEQDGFAGEDEKEKEEEKPPENTSLWEGEEEEEEEKAPKRKRTKKRMDELERQDRLWAKFCGMVRAEGERACAVEDEWREVMVEVLAPVWVVCQEKHRASVERRLILHRLELQLAKLCVGRGGNVSEKMMQLRSALETCVEWLGNARAYVVEWEARNAYRSLFKDLEDMRAAFLPFMNVAAKLKSHLQSFVASISSSSSSSSSDSLSERVSSLQSSIRVETERIRRLQQAVEEHSKRVTALVRKRFPTKETLRRRRSKGKGVGSTPLQHQSCIVLFDSLRMHRVFSFSGILRDWLYRVYLANLAPPSIRSLAHTAEKHVAAAESRAIRWGMHTKSDPVKAWSTPSNIPGVGAASLPRQLNSCDCGAFVACYFAALTEAPPFRIGRSAADAFRRSSTNVVGDGFGTDWFADFQPHLVREAIATWLLQNTPNTSTLLNPLQALASPPPPTITDPLQKADLPAQERKDIETEDDDDDDEEDEPPKQDDLDLVAPNFEAGAQTSEPAPQNSEQAQQNSEPAPLTIGPSPIYFEAGVGLLDLGLPPPPQLPPPQNIPGPPPKRPSSRKKSSPKKSKPVRKDPPPLEQHSFSLAFRRSPRRRVVPQRFIPMASEPDFEPAGSKRPPAQPAPNPKPKRRKGRKNV